MSDESQFEYQLYRESSQKFDYYITGISATLTGFFIHNLQPIEFGVNRDTLQLVGISFTAISLIAGLLQIERVATAIRLNHERNKKQRLLYSAEGMVPNQEMKHQPEDRPMTPEECIKYKTNLNKIIKDVDDGMASHGRVSRIAYDVRSYALVLGILCMLGSKITW